MTTLHYTYSTCHHLNGRLIIHSNTLQGKGETMKKHSARRNAPRFQVGEQLTLRRYLPPVLSGSTVAVLAVSQHHGGDRYQVASSEYPGKPVWADENDLAWPIGEPV